MQRYLWLAALLVMAGMTPAEARECPIGQKLKKVGTVQTGSGNITTQGQDIDMVMVTCTGTACIATLYNGDDLTGANTEDADVVAEPGAAASTTVTIQFDTPLVFSDGITVVDNGNVAATSVFACQP